MPRLALFVILLLFTSALLAQENSCEITRRAALSESYSFCSTVEAGQACYGNSPIVAAEMRSEGLSFSLPNDRLLLNDLNSVTTSTDANQFGMVFLRTTAYSPNSWEGHELSLYLLGDATLRNEGQENLSIPTITTTIISSEGANVRSGASTEYRILTSLFEGDIVKVTGRFQDDSFYQIQLPDGEMGWIASSTIDADLSALPLLEEDAPALEALYLPYAAFSLQTNPVTGPCAYDGDSGLLLQSNTPLRLRVNGAEIILNGTAFIETLDADLRLLALEGTVTYSDMDAEEGYLMRLALLEGRVDSSILAVVAAYPFERYQNLPTEILPRFVYVGIDLSSLITPAPSIDRSPIADVLVTDPCVITTGQGGANLRGGPSEEFPIRGVLGYRETVLPIGRTISNGVVWWELAQNVWINGAVAVTGGDCLAVPNSPLVPVLIPTATPEN
jgi:uncharacterized protein YgiM (DUF1202 family)